MGDDNRASEDYVFSALLSTFTIGRTYNMKKTKRFVIRFWVIYYILALSIIAVLVATETSVPNDLLFLGLYSPVGGLSTWDTLPLCHDKSKFFLVFGFLVISGLLDHS